MPGVERPPFWLRNVMAWLLFSAVMTVVVCLIAGVSITLPRWLFVTAIFGVLGAAEAAVGRRRR